MNFSGALHVRARSVGSASFRRDRAIAGWLPRRVALPGMAERAFGIYAPVVH